MKRFLINKKNDPLNLVMNSETSNNMCNITVCVAMCVCVCGYGYSSPCENIAPDPDLAVTMNFAPSH